MAAYCVCMCVVKKSLDPRLSHVVARLLKSVEHSERTLLKYTRRTFFVQQKFLYSTEIPNSNKGLTDEILKEKLVSELNIAADDKTNKVSNVPGENEKEQDTGKNSETKNGRWTGKNAWKLGLVFLGGWCVISGGTLIYLWGSPSLDPDGHEIEDEYSHLPRITALFTRAFREFTLFTKKIQEPSREKLLPDPLQFPYIQPPYTLVMEMTGVLVHPDWTYSTGWRFQKRPGIEYFLHHVGPPLFEVVIYSQEQGLTADPLVSSLDSQGSIMYRLYRDATRYMNGHHVKDLACLNRDLSKVIMIDWNPKATELQPRNVLHLNKWTGDDSDRTLIDLAHFLKTVATSGVEDVRTVLEYYNQFDDPIAAFKENQRKLQEEQARLAEEFKQHEVKKKSTWGNLFKLR